jgi:hypothetical protein
VCWGGPAGLAAPELLNDKAGGLMHTGRYYDLKAKKHAKGPGPGERAYAAFP